MDTSDRAVAIVGMACRFPGAGDPVTFWQNMLGRKTSFQELDQQRWDHSLYFSENRRAANCTNSRTAALVKDVELFAASKFKISPRRAHSTDPQQRLLLEVAREAMQDGGFERRRWQRENSAVFVGVNLSEYGNLLSIPVRRSQLQSGQFGEQGMVEEDCCADATAVNAYTLLGSNISMCASCLAQHFDCGGPALAIDAACAASSAATVQGVRYLRGLPASGPVSPLVMVGGTYLMMVPDNMVCFSKLGALAERECRPFDAGSDGFILGEGAAVVVLKRLSDAVRDGDKIYAVIKGAAWNNDGRSASPATPSQQGQMRVMREGLRDAAFAPDSVGYIECHGTATAVGDPIEMASLSEVFVGSARPRLGSVKANIGHTLGASGVAGLIRAALALHHKTLPPQAGWECWHPELSAYAEQFCISTEAKRWEEPVRRAVVSSFAFGGTNCFLALEEAPESVAPASPAGGSEMLFPFSAPTPQLLSHYIAELRNHLASPHNSLDDLALALAARHAEDWVAVVRATSRSELLARTGLLLDSLREPSDRWHSPAENCLLGSLSEELPAEFKDRFGEVLELLSGERDTVCPNLQLPFVPLERQAYWFTKSVRKKQRSTAPAHPSRHQFAVTKYLTERLDLEQGFKLHRELILSDSQVEKIGLKGRLGGPQTLLTLADLVLQESREEPRDEFELDLEKNSYLKDHALQGRPILALASALEMMTRGMPFPIVLKNIRVKRGVIIKGVSKLRVRREGELLTLLEVRPTGREVVAFQAELGSELTEPPFFQVAHPLRKPNLNLDTYYSDLTFHGPAFAGILDVFGLNSGVLQGRVRGSCPQLWSEVEERLGWRFDPLVLDSAFQLSMFWCLSETDQGLLPDFIEELVILKPFGLHSVFLDIKVEQADEGGVTGEFLFRCQSHGELRAWMKGARGKFVPKKSIRPQPLR